MNDTDEFVVDMSWNALNAVTKVIKSTIFCFKGLTHAVFGFSSIERNFGKIVYFSRRTPKE